MNTENKYITNNLLTSQNLDPKKLSSLISAYLSKDEALSGVAATMDFELFTPEIITNYLWSLNDMIREARKFYKMSINENA